MNMRISLPDTICLNEIRIAKESIASIPVRECSFSPTERRLLGKPLREGGFISVFSGPECVFLMRTKEHEGRRPEGANLKPDSSVKVFSDLPDEIARRFIFALIKEAAEALECYRGDGWQFFSLHTRFQNGYEALDIDIRSERDYYGIYLDPTLLVLLPLTTVVRGQLYPDRPILRIVAPSDKPRMQQWGHSYHPGWVGLFAGVDNDNLVEVSKTLPADITILLKRTRQAEEVLRYPAFALRVIATREEIDALGLTKQQRRETQLLSHLRLRKAQEWANKLFPSNTLTVNDRQISIENKIAIFQKPNRYPQRTREPCLWYPDEQFQLLFSPSGNKAHTSQVKGLRNYGPFDQNSQERPFSQIRPYCIVRNDAHLIQQSIQFFQFLANGYRKRTTAVFPDDDFEGISPTKTFRVRFTPPEDEDTVVVDGTMAGYEQAAKDILRRWALTENRSNDRIAVVIVPDLYDSDTEEDREDPYLLLKKMFIEGGLPSQMIEVCNLDGVEDMSVAFGHLLWTFALDLYVKMGGKPWTLLRPMSNVNCLIGLGFGRDPTEVQNPIYVGIANVFDEAGQWLSLTSDSKELGADELLSLKNKEYDLAGTNSYKLQCELTKKIVDDSLREYATPSPNRTAIKVVLHKNGRVYSSEALGFLQAFSRISQNDPRKSSAVRFALVSIYKNHSMRMYGPDYPQLKLPMRNTITRGSAYILNENTALVATTGKTDLSYPGIGTPRPLLVERFVPSSDILDSTGFTTSQMYSIEEICEHIFALTKLHWGTTRNIRLPVTSEYAQGIAKFIARSKAHVDLLLQMKKLWWI